MPRAGISVDVPLEWADTCAGVARSLIVMFDEYRTRCVLFLLSEAAVVSVPACSRAVHVVGMSKS